MNIETPKRQVDYKMLMEKARELKSVDKTTFAGVKNMADLGGIKLIDLAEGLDPIVALYAVLRADSVVYSRSEHFGARGDQVLFAEVLRMLGHEDLSEQFKKSFPHIFQTKTKI